MADAKLFEIYINNKPFVTNQDHLTGAEIKQLAGIPLDYGLYVLHNAESVPVLDTEKIAITTSPQFRAIPSATFG